MKILNPLHVVDETFYRKCTGITEKALATYGWTKYDLARKGNFVMLASLSAMGVQTFNEGRSSGDENRILTGLMECYIGVQNYVLTLQWNKKREKQEKLQALDNVVEEPPTSSSIRPVLAITGILFITNGILKSFGIDIIGENPDYQYILDLADYAAGIGTLGAVAAWYFSDQVQPPTATKRKPFFRTTYHVLSKLVKSKINGKIPSPVTEQSYSPLESQLANI